MKSGMKKVICLLVVFSIILANTTVLADNTVVNSINETKQEETNHTENTEKENTTETNTMQEEKESTNQMTTMQENTKQEMVEREQTIDTNKDAIMEKQEVSTTADDKKTLKDGIYVIRSAINEKFVLDVLGASQNNGANVQLYEYSADNQKRFQVTYLGDGYYSIVAVHSNKALDVKDASQEKGANVWQYEQNGTDAQKWMIKDVGNGYYSIISKCNGLYVDVLNANASNYTNIQMCDGNGLNAQKFKFEKVKENNNPPIVEGTQTIADGTYVIRSSIDEKFVLDVLGTSKDNGANVQLYEYSADNQKRFKVTYLGDGYYSIVAVHSNKSLAVKDASKQKGANVYQWEKNEEDSQKWVIKEAGNGYYSIISKCNGLYIDVLNADASNYSNIQMCDGNGLNAQKFKFEEVKENQDKPTVEGTQTIADGTYVIRSAINEKFVFDVLGASQDNGANVQLYEYSADNQKKFKITYLGDGYYSIVAAHSNKALTVKDASQEKGANVYQWEQNGEDNQKWVIKEAGNGYYSMISKCNGLYVDVLNASASNYTNIQMCDGNGLNAQKFKLEETVEKDGKETIEEGTYTIRSAINTRFGLDVSGASQDNGANVQLYEYAAGNQKRFKVSYLGDGYYSIVAVHSNKALDVKDASKEKGANVWQWEQNGSDAQKWLIKDAGNGYYNIISKCNGLYMDVLNANASNFTNIQMCDENGLNAQKFKFSKVGQTTYSEGIYGVTGLKAAGRGGSDLKYYRYGNGKNVFFATFAIHGYEDLWVRDGEELITIANNFYWDLIARDDSELAEKWTIYIFPGVNLDGLSNGWTNNGPGRTTLYSNAPGNKGIDLNRCWQVGNSYTRYTDDRNYNGTEGFQAFEATSLRDFLLSHKSQNGQTVLVDLHGWTQQLIGDAGICGFYQKQFPENDTSSIGRYGTGYLVNWARSNLGANGVAARSALIELPNYGNSLYGHDAVVNYNFANKYITSTLNMLYSL